MATKVFISYKRGSSTPLAEKLYTFFENKAHDPTSSSYDPFMDKDIVGGEDWWTNICQQIRSHSHFISLISREYFDSDFCMEELHFAIRCSSVLVPIRVDRSISPTDIERKLKAISSIAGDPLPDSIQVIDCIDDKLDDAKLDKIMDSVNSISERNHLARKSLAIPRRPYYGPDVLLEIEEQLKHPERMNIDSLIHKMRMMSEIEIYREQVSTLLEQLRDNKKNLSYQQYNEIEEIWRRVNTYYPKNGSAVLDAVSSLGIASIYKNRVGAANDVYSAIDSVETTEVCILGVSLNNFERVNGEFYKSWEKICRLVEQPSETPRNLNIKILIANPYSLGAVMRSKGEEENVPPNNRRLKGEVEHTAAQLNLLQEKLQARADATIHIEARLYLSAPIMFLFWTNMSSFTQQYYFWSAHEATTMPLLRYDKNSSNPKSKKIHCDLHHHFMWIWDNAAVPLTDYLTGHQHGVESGLYKAGAVNVYTSNAEAKARILHLLKNAKEKVWIQGITLHSFFGKDPELTTAFIDVVSKDIDVRVLLLNPDGEQAKYRAYREYLIVQNQIQEVPASFAEFMSRDLHHNTKLSLESQLTKYEIDLLQRGAKNTKFQFRLFDSAPYCFMLIVDDHVLVEQYHYGNEPRAADRYRGDLILGKDMPKIEYLPHVPDVFLPTEETHKEIMLSTLLEDHFLFAFDTATALPQHPGPKQ